MSAKKLNLEQLREEVSNYLMNAGYEIGKDCFIKQRVDGIEVSYPTKNNKTSNLKSYLEKYYYIKTTSFYKGCCNLRIPLQSKNIISK